MLFLSEFLSFFFVAVTYVHKRLHTEEKQQEPQVTRGCTSGGRQQLRASSDFQDGVADGDHGKLTLNGLDGDADHGNLPRDSLDGAAIRGKLPRKSLDGAGSQGNMQRDSLDGAASRGNLPRDSLDGAASRRNLPLYSVDGADSRKNLSRKGLNLVARSTGKQLTRGASVREQLLCDDQCNLSAAELMPVDDSSSPERNTLTDSSMNQGFRQGNHL
jgi:hypothetical protein